jgi:hypothetical protein
MGKVTPVVEKHYRLILWTLPKIANFPKDQRFLLADRIEALLLDVLSLLIEATYSAEKRETLKEANLKVEQMRFMMRIAKDMEYVNIKGYDFFCVSLLEIGRMIGGWRKSEEDKQNQNPCVHGYKERLPKERGPDVVTCP